jgi:DNA repair protein SbcC/Rad50
MRLHHLQVEAFGPFAERVVVDFDALSAAGLFLLTGATGAGKTSILDAVCFALYGEVPGDRQTAKRLRADQAADGEAPRVTLQLTLAGRRFRIVRSPAWQRPKKRGTGTTTQQASVRLCERRGETWHPLSTRLDEAGHQITHLVGLNLTQFCQVAMLPQGRFQAFLRARSEERHKLLQQLFRTDRFEAVERWLADRRRTLRRQSLDHHDRVADLVSRISEAALAPLPERWDSHDLSSPAETGELGRWAVDLAREADESAAATARRQQALGTAEEAARASLEHGRRLHADQQRRAEALAERERLTAVSPDHDRKVERLAQARRAAEVVPLARVADQQTRAAAQARQREIGLSEAAAARVGVPADDLDDVVLTQRHDAAVSAAADARALFSREQELEALRSTVEADSTRAHELARERDELARLLSALPQELAQLRERETEARAAERDLPGQRERVGALRTRCASAGLAVRLDLELTEAADLHRQAVDEALQRREMWLQLQERRIKGVAAELAGTLVVGDACPVCGSADHPHLARPDADAPDAAAEKAARKQVDDAEAERHARDVRVRELTGRLETARAVAGGDLESVRAEVADAAARLEQLTALAESVPHRRERLVAAEARQAELTARREAVTHDLAVTATSLERRREESVTIERELSALLSDTGCDTLTTLTAVHDEVAEACRAALLARDEARRAAEAAAAVQQQLEEAAAQAGFASADAAVEAALDPGALDRLEQDIRAHQRALARTDAVLADETLRELATLPPPDLPALEAAHEQAGVDLTTAATAANVARTRAQRVSGLEAELGTAIDEWAPVRGELDLVTRMAAMTDGTSADNRLRMRLSGYVLASRLAQVVAAANARLSRMSDRRYALEHTGGRGAGESRGGLSLLVRDEWSGEARDPATLSGGETFVVSLALALGLADVISDEVGGADLDTLFVDEGFGSLDAETLDDVMDTLDTLREGGRVVGVVSHVTHLRERISTQLHVEKRRRGSTVRTVHAR